MVKVTISELQECAANVRESIWVQAQAVGREPKIYLHWTAGHYDQKFDDYHINITGSGEIYLTHPLDDVLAHTWRRNTGSVGITLCCAYGANTNNLGSEPPTAKQIEVMAQVIDVVADSLWLTINKKYVLTHGEAADNMDGICPHEEYGPLSTVERWDLQYLGTTESPVYLKSYDDEHTGGNVLRGKALYYQNKRKGALAKKKS